MSRLYEWEVYLTDSERENLAAINDRIVHHKGLSAFLSERRDAIRRKCVGRARNALNKQLRAEHKERAK